MISLSLLPYVLCLAGFGILVTLSIIDLRTWLLPDKYNAILAIIGLAFHASTGFEIIPPSELIYGAALGAGTLYAVRFLGNHHYKQDTLGLGDVKLLGAAGCWLGMEGVVFAITIGACAGLIHGIGIALTRAVQTKSRPNLKRLMLPAGPGFCAGILIVSIWKFYPYFVH